MRQAWLVLAVCLAPLAAASSSLPAAGPPAARVMVVVGAAGEPEYGELFGQWAGLWRSNALAAGASVLIIGLDETKTNDLEQLQAALEDEPKKSDLELWLIFLGHGTFNGKEAKFNLRGPDIAAAQLAEWLKPFERPVAFVNTASSSGPFLNALSAPSRVVITATRSGGEQNFTRFGKHFSEVIASPAADLDKDGQTSVLEAFLLASRRVAEFYETEGRLATEHALLDDNGDGRGTPAEWFRGVRAVKKPADGAALDGLRAHQFHFVRSSSDKLLTGEKRARRDELEQQIERLRQDKETLPEDDYYQQLEKLLTDLALLYQSGAPVSEPPPAPKP